MIWHFTELSANEREMLKVVFLKYSYTHLITWFKERTSDALQVLQTEKYTTTDAQEGKSLCIYTQLLLCHVKVVQVTFVYNQLIISWNNLESRFGVHIFKPKENTTMQNFLHALDGKAFI